MASNEYMAMYRQKPENKAYTKAYNKMYRELHKDKLTEYNRDWRRANRDKHKLNNKLERHRLKIDVLSHYSNGNVSCADCGFSDVRALQLDHIDNNGAESRIEVGGKRTCAGTTYYRWIRKNGYPEGYQVLCANCNVIKFQENINAYHPGAIRIYS